MHRGSARSAWPLPSLLVLCLACGDAGSGDADDPARGAQRAPAPPRDSMGTTVGASDAAVGDAWTGPYQLRGQLEGNRPVTGTLTLDALTAGAAEYEATRTRVRQTYPAYEGPYYGAQLHLAAGADTLRGSFTCAHGPAAQPPLVCEPTVPMAGLEQATLVMQPGGRALLTGSHGEGVSVAYGRFTWNLAGN